MATTKKPRDYAARIAELDAQTEAMIAKGETLRLRYGDELLSGASTAATEKELHDLDLERDRIECEKAAAHRAMAAEAEAAERARKAELVAAINSGAASMATHIAAWGALVDQLEATSVEIATEAAAMIVADRELYPVDWEHEDRRRRPQHPESKLKASLANAPMVRTRGASQKVAEEAKAALLQFASRFVIDEDDE
jgi:hypothetical protein